MNGEINETEASILHLEDDENDAFLVASALRAEWPRIRLTRVTYKEAFDNALQTVLPDIILCDAMVAGVDIPQLVRDATQAHPEVPLIIVSGTVGDERAVELMHNGAIDYVSKNHLYMLADKVYKGYRLRQARIAAVAAEERNKLFAQAAATISWIGLPDGTPKDCNGSFQEFTGYSLSNGKETALEEWLGNIHPDDRTGTYERWKAALATGSVLECEFRLRRYDGEWRHVIARGVPRRDEAGHIIEWVGAGIDISELTKAREMAEAQEAKYHALFDHATDGILLVAGDGKILEANKSAHACLGDEALVGQNIVEYVVDADRPRLRERLSSISTGSGELRSYTALRKDGKRVPLESNSTRLANGHVLSVIRDVTVMLRTQETLAQQAMILKQASDAISICNLHDVIQDWNSSAERIYGWSAKEAIGHDYASRIGVKAEDYAKIREKVKAGVAHREEIHAVHKSGRPLCIDHRCTVTRDQHGGFLSILAIDTDITGEKEREMVALRSERIESLGTLAAGIAHDLNNILAPINMGVSLMQQIGLPRESESIAVAIQQSADRAAKLVRQILGFSHGAEGPRALARMHDIANALYTFCEQTFPKNVTLHVDVPRTLPLIRADVTQIEQVILNLAVNARDAMPTGGALSITGSTVFLDAQHAEMIGKLKEGEYVLLRVRDTGSGISPDILGRIFDPFFTTKPRGQGTGLGLPTCESIVRSHDGVITVDTRVGIGTTFSVFLPVIEDGTLVQPSNPSARPGMFKGADETILVVDDEPMVLSVIRSTLELNNYRVLTAANGAEAIGVFAAHASEVMLVVTDMMMPIMDGMATAVALRKLRPAVRIIAMTGLAHRDQEQRAADAGIVRFLIKPFSADSLLSTVHSALRGDDD
jgi:PAS domain S-box-containing protein